MQLVRIERKISRTCRAVDVDGVKLGIGSDGETSVESDAENQLVSFIKISLKTNNSLYLLARHNDFGRLDTESGHFELL